MSEHSSIEWTDATWNPVTGCTKVSPGCKHCYAETFSERFRGVPDHPFVQGFDLRLWSERLELPLTWKKPKRIFVNSMSDLFHEDVPVEFIDRVFETMRKAHWHTFQVLTKRAERMADYVKRRAADGYFLSKEQPNTWLGVSIENEDYVARADVLVGLPVAVRFLSCEPLLGPVKLNGVLRGQGGINWVIAGGESGHRARPVEEAWIESLRLECEAAGVAFFFKQWGGKNKAKAGRLLHGRTWDGFPAATARALLP
jgi:protein gp37